MMRLLAVDDDEGILELLSEILASFGYADVVSAPSGVDALQIISTVEQPFDCLLLDIQMPRMNGITLCEKVRMIPEYRYTPIIMLTAMVQKEYIDDAFEAGATDYVTKPFDFLDLKKRLADAQRLASERQASISAILEMEGNSEELLHQQNFGLKEPFLIEGVNGCVGYGEFQNYVHQVSKARSPDSYILAVKIGDIDEIFSNCTFNDFRQFVFAAARGISTCGQGKGNIVSYCGDGMFLMMRHSPRPIEDDFLEGELNSGFSVSQEVELMGINPEFFVGEQIHLNSISVSNIESALGEAVESAEQKFSDASKLVVFPESRSSFETQRSIVQRPKKRTYRFRF